MYVADIPVVTLALPSDEQQDQPSSQNDGAKEDSSLALLHNNHPVSSSCFIIKILGSARLPGSLTHHDHGREVETAHTHPACVHKEGEKEGILPQEEDLYHRSWWRYDGAQTHEVCDVLEE